ncbi:APC family permease [Intrasporangium sp.]|uniref:APC family permease n=1 Tax=Intrasporangium sp. TaxID=1925024 RepID=UPI00322163E6
MSDLRPAHEHHLGADLHGSSDVHLKRALGLGGLTLFGLAYLVPLTVFTTYGIVTQLTGGRVAFSYVFTLAAMLFTALSYGRMVVAYPVAGSAYTYTSKSFGPTPGFLSGWALMLDYVLLPMVNYAVIGLFVNAQWPAIPIWVGFLVALLLVTVLNVVGITTIDRANTIVVAIQVVFVVVFVVLAVKAMFGGSPALGLPFSGDSGPNGSGLGPVLAGAAILCLSFLGFDAVSTMAEEAKAPRRDIPRAILLVTIGGGTLFIVLAWLAQVAHPATTFENPDSGATEVMTQLGGNVMATFFTAAYVAGAFGSALTSQASVTRIMYAMGRDGVLPRFLALVTQRWRTPAVAILFVSVVSLLGLWIDIAFLFSIVSFGALTAFSVVNLSVVKHYWIDHPQSRSVVPHLVLPLVGFGLTVWLWTSLSSHALVTGLVWLAVGVVWLAVLTGGFRRRPPEVEFEG